MVNTQLFQSIKGALLPPSNAKNHEGAPAYALSPRHQLARGVVSSILHASHRRL